MTTIGGCDPQNLLPIKDAPFFASFGTTGGNPSGGLCQHAAVCTDGGYRVLTGRQTAHPWSVRGGQYVRAALWHPIRDADGRQQLRLGIERPVTVRLKA